MSSWYNADARFSQQSNGAPSSDQSAYSSNPQPDNYGYRSANHSATSRQPFPQFPPRPPCPPGPPTMDHSLFGGYAPQHNFNINSSFQPFDHRSIEPNGPIGPNRPVGPNGLFGPMMGPPAPPHMSNFRPPAPLPPRPPVPPPPPPSHIKIIGKNYFCELCNIKFPNEENSLVVHRNGKVHEIELLKKLEVLSVVERQCYCTKCNILLGFRFQVAVLHYEKLHKSIYKTMIMMRDVEPIRGDGSYRGRGGGGGSGRGRGGGGMGRGIGGLLNLGTAPAKVALVGAPSADAQKNLPKGFKIVNNTYYCEICSMPLPIDVDLMQHCFGRNHEIKLLIAEGAISMKENKCTCELCKKELGFGFKAALKHIREKHPDDYKKIQSGKELCSMKNFQGETPPPVKRAKVSSDVESSSDNTTSTTSLDVPNKSSETSGSSSGLQQNSEGKSKRPRKTRWSDVSDKVPVLSTSDENKSSDHDNMDVKPDLNSLQQDSEGG